MTAPNKHNDYIRHPPKDERAYEARNEDPYQSRGKYQEPSVCTGCGAVFKKGHWCWGVIEPGAHKHLCPACQRVHDKAPAGVVNITGDFFSQHKEEIISLLHNLEAKEKSRHPLQRIINISMQEQGLIVSLADFHLTKGVIDALQHAYQGKSDLNFAENDGVIRGSWQR